PGRRRSARPIRPDHPERRPGVRELRRQRPASGRPLATSRQEVTPVDFYSVHVEARARADAPGLDASATEQAGDRLMDALADAHPSVAVGPRSWAVTISVQTTTPGRAAQVASLKAGDAASAAGLPGCWPVVRAEAVREDVLADDLAHPTLPEVVSGP